MSKSEWKDGKFIPDQTPVEVPLKFKQSQTEAQRIAAAVSQEFSKQAETKGFETLDESLDFDIPEDEDIFPDSKWEITEMQEEFLYNPPEEPLDIEKSPEEIAIEETDNGSKETTKIPEESERENSTEPR